MSTKPLESILNRDLSIVRSKEALDDAIPVLQDLVNHGTNALMRCAMSVQEPVNEDMAALALYRHILEMTDGVEVLLEHACAIPSIPVLRSSFEALLSLEYILENDVEYSRRSLAWCVSHFLRRLKLHEALIPSTNEGAKFAESLSLDRIGSRVQLPPKADAQKRVDGFHRLLANPKLESIVREFGSNKRAKWYSLFGGPKNLKKLAQHLKLHAQYDWLYLLWSSTSHALDLGPFMAASSSGEFHIGQLRDPEQIREVARFAATFAVDATRMTLGKFRPNEDFSAWYKSNVSERLLKIMPRK